MMSAAEFFLEAGRIWFSGFTGTDCNKGRGGAKISVAFVTYKAISHNLKQNMALLHHQKIHEITSYLSPQMLNCHNSIMKKDNDPHVQRKAVTAKCPLVSLTTDLLELKFAALTITDCVCWPLNQHFC